MKIYDTHSDIMSNLYERYLKGEHDIFVKCHQADLKKGEIAGGIWVVYSACDFDIQKAYDIAINEIKPYINDYNVIYGLEGLRNVLTIEEFDLLYKKGIRHASLTWNEENHLATGVRGNADRGLTNLGREFLHYMNDHHMIIDVSHLNEKSFYDLLEEDPQILIASHSNAQALSNHPRNLTDNQIKALRQANGKIGIVGARNFVSRDKTKQNVQGYVDQLSYIADIVDIDHVMIGIDMMSFLDDFNNSNLDDLASHSQSQNIIKVMKLRGFTDEEIAKVAYLNFLEVKGRTEK